MSEEKQKQLIELRKTYHDKIQIQTRILGQIMNNLKISTRGSFSWDKYLNKGNSNQTKYRRFALCFILAFIKFYSSKYS